MDARALALVVAAGAVFFGLRRGAPFVPEPGARGAWQLPAQGEPFRALIEAAAAAADVPAELLARVLWQESRFNPAARSPAGALGIAQFMPPTAADLGIDPLDPAQAIPAAARYLAQLRALFGDWAHALAAYNWGMGNVSRRGLEAAPAETRNYVASILGDVPYV